MLFFRLSGVGTRRRRLRPIVLLGAQLIIIVFVLSLVISSHAELRMVIMVGVSSSCGTFANLNGKGSSEATTLL